MRLLRPVLWLLIVVLVVLIAGGAALRWLVPSAGDVPPPAWANEYDVTAQPPEQIAPGTVAENGHPPTGWSHLVIKSLPRVKQSEIAKIPTNSFLRGMIVDRTRWMFTLFAADLVEERQGAHKRFKLRAIGLGLGAKVDGKDVVLTIEASKTGPGLDPIQELSLDTGYKVQKQSRVVVHGPSFALVDTPVSFRCGDKNRMVRFRYALLVDAPTGRLDVLCWRLGAEGGECADLTRAVLLKPNTIDEAELLTDPSEFEDKGFGLRGPTTLGFGVDDLPPHRLEVKLPSEVSDLAGKTKYAAEEARALEDGLRKLLPAG
jgi:hypothetical protein